MHIGSDWNGAIGFAEAEQDMRIQVFASNFRVIQGENEAKTQIAESDTTWREWKSKVEE